VESGGVGMTNTINRAEFTGIAAALTNKYTQIATDSACSLENNYSSLKCNEPIYTLIC
jgi:hypothetical protein